MKNINFFAAMALLMVAVYSCKTATKAQHNYDYLYKVWVVDTVLVTGPDAVNIETDKNEYQFTKEGAKVNQGIRTTITPVNANIHVSYVIKNGAIHFDPAATFPVTKFDGNGNVIGFRDVSLPPYEIVELSPDRLTLKNKDMVMKLKAK